MVAWNLKMNKTFIKIGKIKRESRVTEPGHAQDMSIFVQIKQIMITHQIIKKEIVKWIQ